MDIKEIVKSITELEDQLKVKDDQIKTLNKELGLMKSDNENTKQCLKEVENRLKKTLTDILTSVKSGMNPPSKEK